MCSEWLFENVNGHIAKSQKNLLHCAQIVKSSEFLMPQAGSIRVELACTGSARWPRNVIVIIGVSTKVGVVSIFTYDEQH